jgi:RNA polymerase sigma factor (sigma-70 family)
MERRPRLVSLAERARQNHRVSAEVLLTELHVIITRFLRYRLREPEAHDLIQDAAQESIVRIIRSLSTCRADSDAQLISWALAVAQTAAIDTLQANLTFYAARTCVAEDERYSGAHAAPPPLDPEGEVAAWRVEILACVREALGTASDDLHTLMWLRHVEGATWSEVADHLHISPSAAKRRWQRWAARLIRFLDSNEDLSVEAQARFGAWTGGM